MNIRRRRLVPDPENISSMMINRGTNVKRNVVKRSFLFWALFAMACTTTAIVFEQSISLTGNQERNGIEVKREDMKEEANSAIIAGGNDDDFADAHHTTNGDAANDETNTTTNAAHKVHNVTGDDEDHVENTNATIALHRPQKNRSSTPTEEPMDHTQYVHTPGVPIDLRNGTLYLFQSAYYAISVYEHLYPEFKDRFHNATLINRNDGKEVERFVLNSTENDVVLHGGSGDCDVRKKKGSALWFDENFKGTMIIINGESWVSLNKWQNSSGSATTIPKNQYHLGHVADGCQSVRVHFMAQEFVRHRDLWDFFRYESKKPVSTREKFLVYTNGHCVDFREEAFDAIAMANPSQEVEYAAKCFGKMKNLTNVVKTAKLGRRGRWNGNWKTYNKYRFCIVMENKYLEGYITEKIMMAFAGGCIPIYYGSREVFDIFNPKSFIYYDIEKPQLALDEISRLEGNTSAYDEVMAEPILLEGNKTIQKYFSLSDEIIPNAMLKKKIRRMLYARCRFDTDNGTNNATNNVVRQLHNVTD